MYSIDMKIRLRVSIICHQIYLAVLVFQGPVHQEVIHLLAPTERVQPNETKLPSRT